MRTTLELPNELIEEAMAILNTKTKQETVKLALEELVRLERAKKLIMFRGKID